MRQVALFLSLILLLLLPGCVPVEGGKGADSPASAPPQIVADILMGDQRVRLEPGQSARLPARPLSIMLRSTEEIDWGRLDITVEPDTWVLERRKDQHLQRLHSVQLTPLGDGAGPLTLTVAGVTGPDGELPPFQFAVEAEPAFSVEELADILQNGTVTLLVADLALEYELSPSDRSLLGLASRTATYGRAISPAADWSYALRISHNGRRYRLEFEGSKHFRLREGEQVETHFNQADGALLEALQGVVAHLLPLSPEEAEAVIAERAQAAITALKAADMAALADLAHPGQGVRFSSYGYVRLEGERSDVTLTRAELLTAMEDRKIYNWGNFDGTGRPINLQFDDYYQRFIYDEDFAEAPQVAYNRVLGSGNTRNNVFTAYPGAIVVEYHFPGFDEKFGGMDWVSLRLVFQEHAGEWYLVGIIHDQWTI